MRSLSDSTKNVKVTSKVKEDEQNDKINNLIDEVEDLDSRMDSAENSISALSETVSTNTVIANDVQANDISTNTLSADTIGADVSIETKQLETEDLTSTGISRLNTVRATSGEITTLESQNATIENATITNADITNIDIENLSGTNMSYENATFDDVDVNNNIDVTGNAIVGGNVTASGSVTATSGDISSLSSNEITSTDVEATNIEATNGKITFLKNRHLTHEDNYVDINQVVSDTDFVIIELPKIETGDYRVTYKQLVDGYPALTMFSLTLNETADNQWFSYSRAGDQKYMDEIAIKDGKLYIKTWYTGRLYFHSDSLANITGPKSYGEWPIDITDLDYPLFSATRAKATVYTHYVNLGMDADSYGSAVLTINPTSNYEDCATQAETAPEIQYDPNTDTQIYLYVPNQDVNKEADVEFENAKINDTLTIPENAAIDIEDMADNQYITKRDGATVYRDIADGQIDNQPLSRLEDDLVTERKIANWNGATNRQYVPGGEQTVTDTENFVGPIGQNCSIDPNTGAVTPNGPSYYAYGRKTADMYTAIGTTGASPKQNTETYYIPPQESTPAVSPQDYPNSNFASSVKPNYSQSYATSYSKWRGYNDIQAYVWSKDNMLSREVRETQNTSDPLLPWNSTPRTNEWSDYGLFSYGTTDRWRGTADDLISGATENQGIKYVYAVQWDSEFGYVVTDTRNDSYYANLDPHAADWVGWEQTGFPMLVPGTSYTAFKYLDDHHWKFMYAIKENDSSDFLFGATLRWLIRDVTTTYVYPDAVADWAVYWTGNTGNDGYTKLTVNGSTSGIKYCIGDIISNPLTGYDYYGPVDITDKQNKGFVIFINKPASTNFNTHTYTLEKTVTNQPVYSSSITHIGKITEGEWDAGQIVAPKVTTDELTADEITIDNDLTVTGNASIGGNLNVTGTIITVHSEEITTEENTIKLRDGAQTAIQPGEMSGIVIENYDGQGNDSEIALDSNGTLRIGDTNDTEPVATRDEAANFTNGNYIAWDATNSRLVDSGTAPTDLREWALIVGFDEYEDKTGDTSYADIDDILTTLGTYTVSKGITSVLFEAPITSQAEFDLLNLTPTWLASGYLTGTLKILGGNVTFTSKDNNIGWRYNGSTWSSLDVKTHAQIKLNYTGDWSTQTAAQKMDIGESYNADTEAVYVTGDTAGKHLVIAPTETYAKNATAQNVEVDQNAGTVGYLMKGGYSFTGVLKVPVGNPWNLIPTGTNIPAGTIWVN